MNDERQHAHRHQQDVSHQDRVDDRRDENQNQTSETKIHPIKLNSHCVTILVKLCSDQAKANAKTKIFCDICRLFFDLFGFLFHFHFVWAGPYNQKFNRDL